MAFNLSKTVLQRFGLDKDCLFKNNSDVSLTNLSRAIAFSARLMAAGKNSFEQHNPHKVREFYLKSYGVRLHTDTVRGYIDTLLKFGLCTVTNGKLSLKRLRSAHKDRNFTIREESCDSLKKLGNEIAKYIFTAPMRAIGYCLNLKERYSNAKSLSEVKKARVAIRKLGFDIERFVDRGVSYKTLSERFNISSATVALMIASCCKDRIIEKVNHVTEQVIEYAEKKVGNIKLFLSKTKGMYTRWFKVEYKDMLVLQKVSCNTYKYNPDGMAMLGY